MTKSVKKLLLIIGSLSILAGMYLAGSGSDFVEYFSGIFIGITLIGSVFVYKEKSDSNQSE